MNTAATPGATDLTHFDVRQIPCRQKHPLIMARWVELPPGGHFVLVNDHDPVPLYYQFTAKYPGEFSWEYLVAGPEVFQVKITRLAPSPEPSPAAAAAPVTKACGDAAQGIEVDARGLEPPEPMMRILSAVEAMKPGTTLRARTDRCPVHLRAELDARGVRHVSEQTADESWITTLTRA